MYALAVTFDFDFQHGDPDGSDRVTSVQGFLKRLPGLVDVQTSQEDRTRYTIVSTWQNREAADGAFSRDGINEELADIVGPVTRVPQAVAVGS